jgi:hypothetical protein
MLLEETPVYTDGLTTIHFPDVHISHFHKLLDFLYSGQTFVPVDELEQLQDLLALLQIKPNIWRSGDSKKDIVNGECCVKNFIVTIDFKISSACMKSFLFKLLIICFLFYQQIPKN